MVGKPTRRYFSINYEYKEATNRMVVVDQNNTELVEQQQTINSVVATIYN